jgi:MoxR-like ATPase
MYDFHLQKLADGLAKRYPVLRAVELLNAMIDIWGDDQVADVWSIHDVIEYAQNLHGVTVPEDAATTILHQAFDDLDAENGMNWTHLDYYITEWMRENGIEDKGM